MINTYRETKDITHPQNRIGYHNILENEKEILGNKNIIAKINSAEGLEDKEEVYRKHNTVKKRKISEIQEGVLTLQQCKF